MSGIQPNSARTTAGSPPAMVVIMSVAKTQLFMLGTLLSVVMAVVYVVDIGGEV